VVVLWRSFAFDKVETVTTTWMWNGGMDIFLMLAYSTRLMVIMNQGIYFLHILNSQSWDTAMTLQA
jgi:hypothetical protein